MERLDMIEKLQVLTERLDAMERKEKPLLCRCILDGRNEEIFFMATRK